MVFMAPKDENELQHMLKTAVEYPGPAAVRYPRGIGVGVHLDPEPHTLKIGKSEILRQGKDLAIIAIGHTVQAAIEAAKNLEEDDHIMSTVINARFVKPLDRQTILDVAHKIGKIVTIEENVVQGGFGSAVLELLQAHDLDHVIVRCIGLPDKYIEHGPQTMLRHKYGLDAEGIENVVRKMMK